MPPAVLTTILHVPALPTGQTQEKQLTQDEMEKMAGGGTHGGVGQGSGREAGQSADGRTLDAPSRSSIETRLRSMYDEVAAEPVPDRFLDLLNRLERSETPERGGADDEGNAQ